MSRFKTKVYFEIKEFIVLLLPNTGILDLFSKKMVSFQIFQMFDLHVHEYKLLHLKSSVYSLKIDV